MWVRKGRKGGRGEEGKQNKNSWLTKISKVQPIPQYFQIVLTTKILVSQKYLSDP